jgi:hypothetical protein
MVGPDTFISRSEFQTWSQRGAYRKVAIGADNHVPEDVFNKFPSETTVLQLNKSSGWQQRPAFVVTLPRLLNLGWFRSSLMELYFWWLNAPKIVKKRQHSWMSVDERDAATQRYKDTGHWGRSLDASQWQPRAASGAALFDPSQWLGHAC